MSLLRVFSALPFFCCSQCCSSATNVILPCLFLIVNIFYIFHAILNILIIRFVSASSILVVTRIAEASSSCSAWERRSAATNRGLAVSSARTRISLGPAMESMLLLLTADHCPVIDYLPHLILVFLILNSTFFFLPFKYTTFAEICKLKIIVLNNLSSKLAVYLMALYRSITSCIEPLREPRQHLRIVHPHQ